MKAFLMHRDEDFDFQRTMPPNAEALDQDLELNVLYGAMARGDRFLWDTARCVLLSGTRGDIDTILYRQSAVRDCLANPEAVRALYALSVEAVEREKRDFWGLFSRSPGLVLSRSLGVMEMFVEMLGRLREAAEEHAGVFESDGFRALFATLRRELSDEYFSEIRTHLKRLKFRGGALISAEVGPGFRGENHVLREPGEHDGSWWQRIFYGEPAAFSFTLNPRDENGAKALSELKDRGINLVANALAQSADHILSFFMMLRSELAFYIGCINLHERLRQMGGATCFPEPRDSGERHYHFRELYDVCLSLRLKRQAVGNEMEAPGKSLVLVTGANQGGKSTFLRSLGQAQLMMQCGLFAPAEIFAANLCEGLFTHYKREEDASMDRGKLDEEMYRMSAIAENLGRDAMILFNESFAATNEREGSEVARQITCALLEKGIKVCFVTHQYEFASFFSERDWPGAIFLRAERQSDGTRTFRLIEAKPLQTSFGKDLYDRIFSAPTPRSSVQGAAAAFIPVEPPARENDIIP